MAPLSDADLDARYTGFLACVAARRTVFVLVEPHTQSIACVAAHDRQAPDGGPVPVQLVFSTRALAARLAVDDWARHVPAGLALDGFVQGILPELAQAGYLVGPDYGADLAGREVEPLALRDALAAAGPGSPPGPGPARRTPR
jgi:hypothetical protein